MTTWLTCLAFDLGSYMVPVYAASFRNGLGFNNGNGIYSGEQGFAIGGEERLSRSNADPFKNGLGFNNGNGIYSGEQGFAIGGEERLSRSNGYLSELVAAAYVCHVSVLPLYMILFIMLNSVALTEH